MSLKRVFAALGLGPSVPPRPAWGGSLYDSPLHRWLDAAGFPWRATRAELAARYGGVQPHPAYQWPVLTVPTPILEGLLCPFSAHADVRYPLSVPATEFTARTRVGDDARANLRHVAGQLAPHLGATRLGVRNNTFHGEWAFGRASLSVTSWPPDLNRHIPTRNDVHARDPRLEGACHVTLRTGLRPSPTPGERAWLESFVAIARVRVEGSVTRASMEATQVSDLELGPVRELPEGLDRLMGHIGLSGDGQALIVCDHVLKIAPLSQLAGLRVDQYRPGRSGPGGSTLSALCRAEDPAGGLQPIAIAWQGQDSAEELGARLAAATGLPLEIVDAGTED